MSDAARDIFADWSLPIWLTLSIAVTAAIYLRGWLAIRKTRPDQFTDLRLASFLSGLAVLWLAIASPMDGTCVLCMELQILLQEPELIVVERNESLHRVQITDPLVGKEMLRRL